VETFKQGAYKAPERPMILTDLGGRMDTMVMESRHTSLTAYQQWRGELFKSQRFQEGQA
jgi:hypothetical protein